MKVLVRGVITVLIFALILRAVDLHLVWDTLRRVNLELLAIALLLQFGSTSLAAYRWHLVMSNLRLGRSYSFYWRSYYKGMFFNQGLPTSIGGDALRVVDVYRQGFSKTEALYGVMFDRVIGLSALIALNAIAHALNPTLLPREVYFSINIVVLAGLAGFLGMLLLRHVRRFDLHPWLSQIRKISAKLHQAFSSRQALLITCSLLSHLLAMLCLNATGQALGLGYGLLTYLVIVPPVLLFTVIPISLAGWGIREGAMVALFALIGADKAIVLTMSILYGLILVVASFPGLMVYLRGQRRLDARGA